MTSEHQRPATIADAAIVYRATPNVPADRLWRVQGAVAGHLSPITAIDAAPGPDGPVVTGGYDGQVICWDPAITSPRWALRFDDLVNAVDIDPGANRVAIAVADGYAYVAELGSGLIRRQLGPHGDDVNDVSWHPGQPDMLAVVCDAWDRQVHLWELADGHERATSLPGHEHGVFAVEFSPVGERFATASEDSTVRVWSIGDSRAQAVLGHPGDVETLAWSPGGEWLATGCDDTKVRLWATTDWTVGAELGDGRASVRKVGFSPSGRSLAAASYDGTVRVYDVGSLRLRHSCRSPRQWERACLLTGDDRLLVGSFGPRPRAWSLTGGNRASAHLPSGAEPLTWGVNAIALASDGAIYAGTDCGIVSRLGTNTLVHDSTTLITSLRLSCDQVALAIGDYLGRIFLAVGEAPATVLAQTAGGPLNAIEWMPDGTLVTGGYDGSLRRWSRDGDQLDEATCHRGPIKAVTWCPAAGVLVAGSSDDTLSSWRVGEGFEEVRRYRDASLTLVNDVAASPREPWVAVVSRDGHVRLWDPRDPRPPVTLPRVHRKSAKAVAVSLDGRVVVSGSYDGTVCWWHLDAHQRLCGWRRLILHGKPGVSCVAASEDRFVTAGWDGTVAEWSLDGELLRHHVPHLIDGRA